MSDITWTNKDLGPVDAYALAVAGGYTGTKEQWIEEIANASTNASNAEAYAKGTRGGEAVASDDPAYHNNAEYYNGLAQTAKTAAQDAAETASAAYNVNLLAPNFDVTAAYPAGQHVIYDGGYYVLPAGHTANETWANTSKTQLTVGGENSDLKSALDADILNLNELLKFGTAMNFNFTASSAINDSGAIFNTGNALKRIATIGFIDISAARKTNSIPISDNAYNEKLTYNVTSGYRLFVAYYSSPSESSFVGKERWLTGSGTLSPTADYMRVCYASENDSSTLTIADADKITISLYPTIKSVIDKIVYWGLVHKGYASVESFENNIDTGLYIIDNNYHQSTLDNPISGENGALIVIPSSRNESTSQKLITRLIQFCISDDGRYFYCRRVSGTSTKTFGEWQEISRISELRDKVTDYLNDAIYIFAKKPVVINREFVMGGVSSSGALSVQTKRIRNKNAILLLGASTIHYEVQSGYRLYGAFYTSESTSTFISNFGWLTGNGDITVPATANYMYVMYASLNDSSALTPSDSNVVSLSYASKINNVIVKQTKWLAVGDSITAGVYSVAGGSNVHDVTNEGWVPKLANALGYELTKMGSAGMGYTASITGRLPETPNASSPRIDMDTLLTQIEAMTEDFNLITIAFGTNDYGTITGVTLDTIRTGCLDCLNRITTKFPKARVVCITPFNIYGHKVEGVLTPYGTAYGTPDSETDTGKYAYGYKYGESRRISLKQVADLIKECCEVYGVECIYASDGFLLNINNMPGLLLDGVHPSLDCYDLIAKGMAHYLWM